MTSHMIKRMLKFQIRAILQIAGALLFLGSEIVSKSIHCMTTNSAFKHQQFVEEFCVDNGIN